MLSKLSSPAMTETRDKPSQKGVQADSAYLHLKSTFHYAAGKTGNSVDGSNHDWSTDAPNVPPLKNKDLMRHY